MDSQKRLTESIRVLAVLFNETNSDLAHVLGQSPSSAASKRTGRLPWTPDDVEKLAEHWGVTVEFLKAGPRRPLGLPDAA